MPLVQRQHGVYEQPFNVVSAFLWDRYLVRPHLPTSPTLIHLPTPPDIILNRGSRSGPKVSVL